MALTEFAPAQLPQHFAENDNFSTQPVYTYNGNWFQFLPDEVGSIASGGGTSQIFIYKSTDLGVTWVDITPVAPQKFTGPVGDIFVKSGTVVYSPILNGGAFWKMFGFDLATEAWIADGPNTSPGVPIAATDEGMQSATRADGTIVIVTGVFGGNGDYPDHAPVMMVYDPASASWTLEPTEVSAALAFSQVAAGGIDSVNHAHFFAVLWSGGAFGSGSATLQHFVVLPDNSIVGPALAYTFVNIPDKFFPWIDVGEPAFYLDVTPNTRTITLPVGTRDNQSPFTGNIVGLILLTAVESDTPIWSTVNVPTGENFADVTLANSQVAADFVASLLPIQFGSQTTLEIFWTSNGQAIAAGLSPWDNYARHVSYTDGAFSAVTTEFSSLGTKVMPGPFYPVLLSNSGGVAQVGGLVPTIDFSLFTSQMTKYDALKDYWLSFSVVGPGSPLSLDCGNPPVGFVAIAYASGLIAMGGTPPYTFTIIAGSLPPGLSLNASTGVISGIPNTAGTYSYTARVTDSSAGSSSVDCSIIIDPGTQTNPVAGGGGTGRKCRTVTCHSRLQNTCIGWGPLTITQDRTGVHVVYQDSRGDLHAAPLRSGDPIQQIAGLVTQWERAPVAFNNPGNLRARGGMLDKDGALVAFSDAGQGRAALLEVIQLSLMPDGEVI
jgi:hypothetical protein